MGFLLGVWLLSAWGCGGYGLRRRRRGVWLHRRSWRLGVSSFGPPPTVSPAVLLLVFLAALVGVGVSGNVVRFSFFRFVLFFNMCCSLFVVLSFIVLDFGWFLYG